MLFQACTINNEEPGLVVVACIWTEMSWFLPVEAQGGTGFPTSCDAQGKGLLICVVESPFTHRGLVMAGLAEPG